MMLPDLPLLLPSLSEAKPRSAFLSEIVIFCPAGQLLIENKSRSDTYMLLMEEGP